MPPKTPIVQAKIISDVNLIRQLDVSLTNKDSRLKRMTVFTKCSLNKFIDQNKVSDVQIKSNRVKTQK
jgi:hypothetical protein